MGEALHKSDTCNNDCRIEQIASLWLHNYTYILHISLILTHGNNAEAEDLISQTLIKLLSNENYTAGNILNPKGLFTDILRKEFYSNCRKRKYFISFIHQPDDASGGSSPDVADDTPTQFDQCADREEMSCVMQAIDHLPFLLRQAFLWRIFDECSYEEIATRQGISQALARKRIQLAREKLRNAKSVKEK